MMKDVQKLSPDLFQQANQNNVDNEVIARPSLTFWQDVRRRLFQHKGAMFGLVLLTLIILLAILGPMVSKHSYKEQDLDVRNYHRKFQLLKMFIGYHLTVQINTVLTNMKT